MTKISTEEKLKRYERFFHNAQDLFFILDRRGKFIDMNPRFAELLGYTVDELIDRTSRNIVYPDDLQKLKEFFTKVLTGTSQRGEFRFVTRDGRVKWFELVEWPVFEKGEITEIEGIARDVTESKELEKRLKNLNEQLRVLMRVLRHDIMNNLTVISGVLQVVEVDHDKELIEMALSRIEKTIEFIKRVKEIEMAIENGGELREIEIRNVVDNVLATYPQLKSRVEGEGKVIADEAIYSVIENIIHNAVVHSESDKLDVEIRKNGEWVEIKISDYGKGIPEKIKDKIFVEGFRHGKSGGTGLGLYIVKKLVEKYGGSVEVKDTAPRGATFIIRLRSPRD